MEYRIMKIVRPLDKVYKVPKWKRNKQIQPLAEE